MAKVRASVTLIQQRMNAVWMMWMEHTNPAKTAWIVSIKDQIIIRHIGQIMMLGQSVHSVLQQIKECATFKGLTPSVGEQCVFFFSTEDFTAEFKVQDEDRAAH